MPLFLDNFTGSAGAVSGHTADTGSNWTGSDSQAQINGSGRLYCNTSSTSPNLVTNAAIPQANVTIDIAIAIGTLPSPATYDYVDRLVLALWGGFNYSLELHSRDSGFGNTPHFYAAAQDSTFSGYSYDTSISGSTTHTVRFDIFFGSHIDVYYDSVLHATTGTGPYVSGASTAFGGYLDRYQDPGAPNQTAMLYIDSITMNGAAVPAAFWTNFVGSFESP
jgi:hypothetical protein